MVQGFNVAFNVVELAKAKTTRKEFRRQKKCICFSSMKYARPCWFTLHSPSQQSSQMFSQQRNIASHTENIATRKSRREREEREHVCATHLRVTLENDFFTCWLDARSRVAVRINIIQSDASFSGRQSDIGFYPRAHEPDRHSVQLILIIGEASINIQLWRCERFQITENSGKLSSWRAVINCVISSESTTLIKHIYKSLKVSKDASHIHVIFGNYSYQHALPHKP